MIRSSIFTLLFSLLLITLSCSESESSHEASHLLKFINSPKKLRAIRNAKFDLLRERKDSRSPIYVGEQHGLMAADRIEELPGQPEGVKLEQFAGYVTVDPVKGRALFYYFVESDQDSGSKPLVLWLNGGPGCSSFGIGAMQELGPFRVNSDGEYLSSNKAAWNNVANVIFLESPAGVGFSYSNTSSDYQRTGDKSTADDSYTFLINWLDRFPHYKNRDFFITGESYAGHYIPELASLILNKNRAAKNTIIHLKGIAMGNAYIDGATNDKAMYNYLWTHALIADETYKGIQSSCDFSASSITDDCNNILNTVNHDIDDIDIYDIYAPLCKSGSKDMKTTVQPDPCAGNYVHNYLNLIAVQKALHINSPLPHLWKACGGALKGWHDAPSTLLPTIQELMKTDLRIWIYSGDQDALVSVTSTRYSIEMLKLQVESQWKPWYTNGEVGGYVIGYKGLVLATVRGAGHEVPSYQPERSLTLFSSFLKGGFEKN